MNRFGIGVAALGAMLICVGCGTTTASSKVTELRMVNVAPTAPTLDLLIDNKTVFSAMAYGVPTAFANVAATSHDFKLFDPAAATDVLDIPKETFVAGTSYTYLMVGDANSATGIRVNQLVDDHTVADKGNFKLRVVNGSPNAGAVNVYIVGTSAVTTITGIASNTASAYQSVASGGYPIYISQGDHNTCLDTPLPVSCLVRLDGLNGRGLLSFQAGQNRTLIMVNQIPGGGTFTTLPMLADLN